MVTARAITNESGHVDSFHIKMDGLATGFEFDPWKFQTQPFGRKMMLVELRNNVRGIDRLDQFGTLVMYALQMGFEETDWCTLGDNKKNVCHDLYVGKYLFRKLNGKMHKKKLQKGKKNG